MNKPTKQRLTAFINPDIVTRAKIRGALEGLTISDVVERALDEYAPKIEKSGANIKVKFAKTRARTTLHSKTELSAADIVPKHTKLHGIPRQPSS